MRPDGHDPSYLQNMLQIACEIESILQDVDESGFLRDRLLIMAMERAIEMLGSHARNVSDIFKDANDDFPWRELDKQWFLLSHDYAKIKHKALFRLAHDDMPEIILKLRLMLNTD